MIRKKYSRDYQTETVLIKGGKKTVVSYIGRITASQRPRQP